MQVAVGDHPYIPFFVKLETLGKVMRSCDVFKGFVPDIKIVKPAAVGAYPEITFHVFQDIVDIVVADAVFVARDIKIVFDRRRGVIDPFAEAKLRGGDPDRTSTRFVKPPDQVVPDVEIFDDLPQAVLARYALL